jgi:hypothetical protein
VDIESILLPQLVLIHSDLLQQEVLKFLSLAVGVELAHLSPAMAAVVVPEQPYIQNLFQ